MINRRKDGSCYTEEMTITPLKDSVGEITHFVAVKQDITERKKLEAQYLRAQRMESIGTLASGIAHDLNNVLAPILMSIEFLRLKCPEVETEELLAGLEASAQRGSDLVRQSGGNFTAPRNASVTGVLPAWLSCQLRAMTRNWWTTTSGNVV
jgi:two-component system, cell cycle sensor histidine kinase and response regulator CckA